MPDKFDQLLRNVAEGDAETAVADILGTIPEVAPLASRLAAGSQTSAAGHHPKDVVLQRLANVGASGWRGPAADHVAGCLACLDTVLALRGRTIVFPVLTVRSRSARVLGWAAAAALVALLGGGLWRWGGGWSHPAEILAGRLVAESVSDHWVGGPLAHGVPYRCDETVTVVMTDGSRVTLEPDARVVFERTLGLTTRVRLTDGILTASVPPVRRRVPFEVRTALGTVTVLGTEFQVVCDREAVTEFFAINGLAAERRERWRQRVRVTVAKGRVRLNNGHESALIDAGEWGWLRQGDPRIDTGRLGEGTLE